MAEEKIVLVSCPDTNSKSIATSVINAQLAACVNIIPKVESIYFWEGKLCEDNECLLIIKTTSSCLIKLTELIKELHPYEIPEIISLPIENGYNPYLNWIHSSCKTLPK
jgi:periplasmic divalent cation tolerance protein